MPYLAKKFTIFWKLFSKWWTEKNRTPEKNRAMQHAMVLRWTLWTLTCMLAYDGKNMILSALKVQFCCRSKLSQIKVLSLLTARIWLGLFESFHVPHLILLKIQPFFESFQKELSKALLPLAFYSAFSVWTLLLFFSSAELRLLVPQGLL